jgi:hypothetical protein
MPFSALSLTAGRRNLGDLDRYALTVVAAGESADLAVVDPGPVAGADVVEGRRQRAVNAGGLEDRAGRISQRRATGRGISREKQRVADLERNRRGHARQPPDLECRDVGSATAEAHSVSRGRVDGLIRLGEGGATDAFDDRERALATAQVVDQQRIANAQ